VANDPTANDSSCAMRTRAVPLPGTIRAPAAGRCHARAPVRGTAASRVVGRHPSSDRVDMSSLIETWRDRRRRSDAREATLPRLPCGTVTLLLTDIEGSTRLLCEYGEVYAELLAVHRRRIRAAIAAHDGVETGTAGDAVFAAFGQARDAVAAAADAQAALAGGPVRVRMGLHTGTPLVTVEGYVGIDVHRAARIAAAGHGGQVLLSQRTRNLVDVDTLDLGEYRLKGLLGPERIYQLGHDAFAPLAAAPAKPTCESRRRAHGAFRPPQRAADNRA
jgi:class 3 adenylate cyclase